MTGTFHIVCPACAAVNRLRDERPASAGRCGKCGSPLFLGKPIELDAGTFERHTQRGDIPVLVDVWAPWCGPCRMMAPAFEAAAAALEPEMRVAKLNSEAEPGIATRLGIRGIPTMLLFMKGNEVARVSGAMGMEQIVSWARGQLRQHG